MGAIRFTTPPGWPEPPAGWLPPRNWQPDWSWPAPPSDWQFYRDSYGYPTPAPVENWQPVYAPTTPAPQASTITDEQQAQQALEVARRTGRGTVWLGAITLVLALALIAAGGYLWMRKNGSPLGPDKVASVTGLYNPPLGVGTAKYQLVEEVKPDQVFDGDGDCNKRSNDAVKGAKEAVVAATERGWIAVTWRFDENAPARTAFDSLGKTLDGCSDKSFTFANPVAGDQFVQFDQLDKKGTAYGKVVLTSDANTLTWIVGGREDMGKTAFNSIRKRLEELQ